MPHAFIMPTTVLASPNVRMDSPRAFSSSCGTAQRSRGRRGGQSAGAWEGQGGGGGAQGLG